MATQQLLNILDWQQSLELLRTAQVGRLVFTRHALPAVEPVSFRLWRGDVVIRIAGGWKVAVAVRDNVVAFEADQLSPELCAGWTVTVVGRAQLITDVDEVVELSQMFLQAGDNDRRDYFVRIRIEKVTGRLL